VSNERSKAGNQGKAKQEGRMLRLWRRLWQWRIQQHLARGLAYGVGSGAVSLLLLWAQGRY
jgi:hypothetical protein